MANFAAFPAATGNPMQTRPIVSLQARILQQQAAFPEATGALSWILSALSISTKMIAAQVRRARLCGGVGTIFSILRHDRRGRDAQASLLQPGAQQVAAGYVLYGPSC